MFSETLLDALPVWGLFLAVLFTVLVSVECGFRLGAFRGRRSESEKEAPVGAMVGATLGLLAFMLAYTFGLASERFDKRKEVVLDEANAIGTAYLRAGTLPGQRDAIRTLLREYVDVRLDAVKSGQLAEGIRRSEQLQGRLWAQAEAAAGQNPSSIIAGLFVQSLNEVIDLHAKRITAGRNRIPGAIWTALFVVAVLSLGAMGYHAGLSHTTRSPAALAVAITFSIVIWLIADLDRPMEGLLSVSQQALIDVRRSMQQPTP
jgi:hypothetical protein